MALLQRAPLSPVLASESYLTINSIYYTSEALITIRYYQRTFEGGYSAKACYTSAVSLGTYSSPVQSTRIHCGFYKQLSGWGLLTFGNWLARPDPPYFRTKHSYRHVNK
jgi:hypothetical protein